MFVISNKLSICFYMEPKRFYEVLFRGIFAAFPKMESVEMNCNDTCKTIIGDDITKSAKIYCANFVFHGMPVELVTQLATFATKNPIAVIFTLWLSACCSLQRLNDSRPCLSKIHISNMWSFQDERLPDTALDVFSNLETQWWNTMYFPSSFMMAVRCVCCLSNACILTQSWPSALNPWLSDSCPTCCIQVLGGTINPVGKALLLPASLAHTGT